ncbi:MAG: helix-turn-helix transcriptional regulator [Planctomycetaceae bacterium]
MNWLKVGRGRTDSRNAVTDLGATMKAVREQSNMSVSQLAKKLNVAPATLIKFEDRGHPVSVLIVQRMANALGYDVTLKKRSGT